MKGVDPLSVASGIALVVGGLVLLFVAFIVKFLIIYGVIVFIIGVVILLSLKKQEFIEPIKRNS